MFLIYLGILSLGGLVWAIRRAAGWPGRGCWTTATAAVLLVFCVDLGRTLLAASATDLGWSLGSAVVPVTLGLALCRPPTAGRAPNQE